MRFDNSRMRRQDRQLDCERAKEILLGGEYGILSMADKVGGYGVPLNYAVDGDRIYLHCAPEGRKLEAIAYDDRVSFCVVGHRRIIPEEFTTEFESIIVQGRARIVVEQQERVNALRLILEKYSKEYIDQGMKAIERSIHRTTIIAIDVEAFSGKVKMQ